MNSIIYMIDDRSPAAGQNAEVLLRKIAAQRDDIAHLTSLLTKAQDGISELKNKNKCMEEVIGTQATLIMQLQETIDAQRGQKKNKK